MMQTWAMLLDAYRDLNARKLFWLAIAISLLVVLLVGLLGINAQGVNFAGYSLGLTMLNTSMMSPETFYKTLFLTLGIKIWLAWAATILALVSTAGMIPDLVAGGSIDMMLSKPISRGRLFLTRWCTGLLFAALQALIFTTACFLVIGIRGGAWEPSLFLAVPVLVIFYSYLFCICGLVGLLTRSTIAALIVTMLAWVGLFGIQTVEEILNGVRITMRLDLQAIDRTMASRLAANPEADVSRLQKEREDGEDVLRKLNRFYWPAYALATCVPKTKQTTEWLERRLIEAADIRHEQEDERPMPLGSMRVRPAELAAAMREDADQRKGALWTIGTSLGFEVVVLAFCVWYFRRRDY